MISETKLFELAKSARKQLALIEGGFINVNDLKTLLQNVIESSDKKPIMSEKQKRYQALTQKVLQNRRRTISKHNTN